MTIMVFKKKNIPLPIKIYIDFQIKIITCFLLVNKILFQNSQIIFIRFINLILQLLFQMKIIFHMGLKHSHLKMTI